MGWRKRIRAAAERLSRAETAADQVAGRLELVEAGRRPEDAEGERRRLRRSIAARAESLCDPWLAENGADPAVPSESRPRSGAVCIGRSGDGDEAFPVLVDLLGAGHLSADGDAADPRVAGFLQSLLVRLVGAYPKVEFGFVDGVTLGQVFSPLSPLVEAELAQPVATDAMGLARLLGDWEKHVSETSEAAGRGVSLEEYPYKVLVVAGMPPQVGKAHRERLAALAHAGRRSRTHLVLCGWRPSYKGDSLPPLENTVHLTVGERVAAAGLAEDVVLAKPLAPGTAQAVVAQRAAKQRDLATVRPEDVVSPEWSESSVKGLSTVAGRDTAGQVSLSFDDATPHWMVGGRTGSGKTVFLLDVLYGLSSRYSPRELELYLLDFKEGVSFNEFTPSPGDPTWIPQVKAVGVESDRQYGLAVLTRLRKELSRRAGMMKRAGVTSLAKLREARPEAELPRILAVIDEFHVLLAGNDTVAREAVSHLEELARKGRSYGVHMILASQTISGVEALYAKKDSIFGQFPMRVALPGAKHLLEEDNDAAADLAVGQAVVNEAAGIRGHNRLIAFPDMTADEERLAGLRREWWERRGDDTEPLVFRGFDERHLDDDPRYTALRPDMPPRALIGRAVDVELSTVSFPFGPTPGRHLAVVGTQRIGSDLLVAAAESLAKTYRGGEAEFHIGSHAVGTEDAAGALKESLAAQGHTVADLDVKALAEPGPRPRYAIWFGADGGAGDTAALRKVLEEGPSSRTHLIGWWRGARRFLDDIGGSGKRESCAGLVLLNVSPADADAVTGSQAGWNPRTNRCLFVDRHEGAQTLTVPFVQAGRLDEFEE
ncbi:FtsK/SpoIIIE domain-containing protein [Salininema proteolyticum]|uniref:FtsK/SpoIIIE domain-containing protein n=1 Tax=Salininema proteolyticum TaxID=1607685 RepID=A0ABV8TTD5_9ACTN